MTKRVSALQSEIRQGKPFPSAAQEATVGLLRTADVLRRRVAEVLSPHGITPQQYNVLRILRGSKDQGLPTLEIADRMIEKAPGITRLLDRMEAKSLVIRKRCPEDRRQVLCFISREGLGVLARLDEPVMKANAHILALSSPDVRKLIELLDAIRAASG